MTTSAGGRVREHRRLSVAVLAGGRSTRMRSDKAFLSLNGRSFISIIADEASRVSSDVLVVIGGKEKERFRADLGARARIVNDSHRLGTPLGGMLTAFETFTDGYAAVVACDAPLIKGEVLEALNESAASRSAAVPLWETGRMEPLCSVYDVREARKASLSAISTGRVRCIDMVSLLPDVNFVPVSDLRPIDAALGSLVNVNTPEEFRALEHLSEVSPGASRLRSDE